MTSPFAQDGKSTVAANLATTFAQHGMKTLLIDCDLRRPTSTKYSVCRVALDSRISSRRKSSFPAPGEDERRKPIADHIGRAAARSAGARRQRTHARVAREVRREFDVIVLDTPPVLPVADSAILASLSDGVLLVVRAGQTDRRAAQLAVQHCRMWTRGYWARCSTTPMSRCRSTTSTGTRRITGTRPRSEQPQDPGSDTARRLTAPGRAASGHGVAGFQVGNRLAPASVVSAVSRAPLAPIV